MSNARPTIVFAGGGTGGHLMPSLAVAERLAEQADALKVELPRVHFVCSAKALDAELLRKARQAFTPLGVVGLGGNPVGWPRFVVKQLKAIHVARCDLAMREAGCVVSMGGYVSSPVVVAARRLNLPVILVNLDAVAGKANRRLARRADRVFSTQGRAGLPGEVMPVGFPIRRAALADRDVAASRRALGLDPDRPTLLITGASQGAMTVNQALIELTRNGFFAPFRERGWQVLHLAGAGHVDPVAAAYREHQVDATVLPFCDTMGLAWGAANLAVSRAGAGSAAEVRANTVPTIFMPYPFHRDEHQRHNVADLAELGAAEIVADRRDPVANAQTLGPILGELMTNDVRRKAMRTELQRLATGQRDGAEVLANAALEAVSGSMIGHVVAP